MLEERVRSLRGRSNEADALFAYDHGQGQEKASAFFSLHSEGPHDPQGRHLLGDLHGDRLGGERPVAAHECEALFHLLVTPHGFAVERLPDEPGEHGPFLARPPLGEKAPHEAGHVFRR